MEVRRRRVIKRTLVIKSPHTDLIVEAVMRAYPMNSHPMSERARRLMTTAAVMTLQGREVATTTNDTYLGVALQKGVDLGAEILRELWDGE